MPVLPQAGSRLVKNCTAELGKGAKNTPTVSSRNRELTYSFCRRLVDDGVVDEMVSNFNVNNV